MVVLVPSGKSHSHRKLCGEYFPRVDGINELLFKSQLMFCIPFTIENFIRFVSEKSIIDFN